MGGEVPAAPSDDPTLVEGQSLYSANCVSCHGAEGGGGTGPELSDGRVLERFPQVGDQLTVVTDGRGAMPAFGGKLSDDEIEAVVAYTREVLATAG